MSSAHPPLEHLLTSSIVSLESFELSRLNAVANLRKEFRQVIDEWIEAEIEARLSRWILNRRREAEATSQPSAPPLSEQSAQALPAGAANEIEDRAQARLPKQSGGAHSSALHLSSSAGDSSGGSQRMQELELLAENTGSSDPTASTQEPRPATAEECAADALRWLERFVRNQGESLHSSLNALVEQQIDLQFSADAQLAQCSTPPPADQSRAAPCSAADGNPCDAIEMSSENAWQATSHQSRIEPATSPRPPMRQIPLFRARVEKAS